MNDYIEHVLNPVTELAKAKALLQSGGVLVGEGSNSRSIDHRPFGRYWAVTMCHVIPFKMSRIDFIVY
jgi:hypothetical protein